MIKNSKHIVQLLILFFLAFSAKAQIDSALIFPVQKLHVHSSSIVELPNGDFLVCWFKGSGERWANDVLIEGARLKKGEKKWSAHLVSPIATP